MKQEFITIKERNQQVFIVFSHMVTVYFAVGYWFFLDKETHLHNPNAFFFIGIYTVINIFLNEPHIHFNNVLYIFKE